MNTQNKLLKATLLLASVFFVGCLVFSSCSNGETTADAYGNFEAIETMVSAESNGKILFFNVEEGISIKAHTNVGLVDTILPALQLVEIKAQRGRIKANLNNIDAQLEVLNQQKANAMVDFKRIKNLKESGAATQKQFDDINGQLKIIDKQAEAYGVQKNTIKQEIKVLNAKKLMITEQLKKCRVINPTSGIVLEKYAEQGEITAAGKPLYKIANLDKIFLRAYVSGGQLHQVQTGQTCSVRIDKGKKEYLEFTGIVSWISNQAEFTPKIIQTKKERVNMVYAIKVEVNNDGTIKMGMPGEVVFNE